MRELSASDHTPLLSHDFASILPSVTFSPLLLEKAQTRMETQISRAVWAHAACFYYVDLPCIGHLSVNVHCRT